MFANKEKAELIMEVYGSQRDNSMQNMIKLIDLLIQEARVDNDVADTTVFLQNQGKISGYSVLKEYIERGLPALSKVR